MVVNNMTLAKIGSVMGFATVTMGLALRSKIDGKIKETEYYKEALKIVRTNRGAVHLLGEPIKDGTIDIGNDKDNYTKNNSARYEVPIRGPKQKGTLYFWAKKEDYQWTVSRVELALKNEPNRRLLIKSNEK